MKTTVHFDHNSSHYGRNWREINADLRNRCPMAWSTEYGGFWVVSRYDDVARIARDDETFSSAFENGGVQIPASPTRALPIMMDPPEFLVLRRLLNPWFSPARLARWESLVRRWTTECVDKHIATGQMDLVMDLGNPVPAMLTLSLLGLPIQDWPRYAEPQHLNVAYPTPGENDPHRAEMYQRARDGLEWCAGQIAALIPERRARPGTDLLSFLVTATAWDRKLTDEEIIGIAGLTIAGGVDTTTALLACALLHLHRNPGQRARLIAEPELLPVATEEFLRYYSVVQGLARTAKRDVEVGGQNIAAGERLFINWASANFDADRFDDPDTFIIDREPNRHAAFGLGGHRCIGSNFARMEFQIMLAEVLRRIPDYVIDEAACEPYEAIVNANGYVCMPATFTPGAPG